MHLKCVIIIVCKQYLYGSENSFLGREERILPLELIFRFSSFVTFNKVLLRKSQSLNLLYEMGYVAKAAILQTPVQWQKSL